MTDPVPAEYTCIYIFSAQKEELDLIYTRIYNFLWCVLIEVEKIIWSY